MGQHKHNPTAQFAKEGKLPPKEPKLSKREIEMYLANEFHRRTGLDTIYHGCVVKERESK